MLKTNKYDCLNEICAPSVSCILSYFLNQLVRLCGSVIRTASGIEETSRYLSVIFQDILTYLIKGNKNFLNKLWCFELNADVSMVTCS